MRVHTKKANKDYPEFGIKKGDTYYTWAFFRQRPIKSKTPPTRTQLTQNETLSAVYSEYDGALPTEADGVGAMAEAIREAGTIASDKRDGMPEGLQEGDVGQRLQEQSENCESAADALDEIADTLREEEGRVLPPKPEREKDEKDDAYEARLDALLDEAGIDEQAEYYDFDRDAWTWEFNAESLHNAISETEPELG